MTSPAVAAQYRGDASAESDICGIAGGVIVGIQYLLAVVITGSEKKYKNDYGRKYKTLHMVEFLIVLVFYI
jgi:hypothetical protein